MIAAAHTVWSSGPHPLRALAPVDSSLSADQGLFYSSLGAARMGAYAFFPSPM